MSTLGTLAVLFVVCGAPLPGPVARVDGTAIVLTEEDLQNSRQAQARVLAETLGRTPTEDELGRAVEGMLAEDVRVKVVEAVRAKAYADYGIQASDDEVRAELERGSSDYKDGFEAGLAHEFAKFVGDATAAAAAAPGIPSTTEEFFRMAVYPVAAPRVKERKLREALLAEVPVTEEEVYEANYPSADRLPPEGRESFRAAFDDYFARNKDRLMARYREAKGKDLLRDFWRERFASAEVQVEDPRFADVIQEALASAASRYE